MKVKIIFFSLFFSSLITSGLIGQNWHYYYTIAFDKLNEKDLNTASINSEKALNSTRSGFGISSKEYKRALNLYIKVNLMLGEQEFGLSPYYVDLIRKLAILSWETNDTLQSDSLYGYSREVEIKVIENSDFTWKELMEYSSNKKDNGNYELSIIYGIQATKRAQSEFGDNSTNYAISLSNLALIYSDMAFYEKAEPLMKEATRIFKDQLGDNHQNYLNSLINLAQLNENLDRFEMAEMLILESIRINKEKLGEDNPDYASYINNLATLYHETGRYLEAELLMKEALRIDKEKLGENHPSYVRDLNNLAQLNETMCRFEQAESLMKEVIRIFKSQLGENHTKYQIALSNLAWLYKEMGRYEQAVPLMKEAVMITKEELGIYHPAFAICSNNLALLYKAMGRNEQAESLIKEALQIVKVRLGEEHSYYANYLNNLAQLYEDMGRNEQAELLIKEALQIHKEKLGENHPEYARDLNSLAQLYADKGFYEQAEQLMKEALEIVKEKLGEGHPDFAGLLNNLAALYKAMNRYKKAGPLMIQAFQILNDQAASNTGYLSPKETEQFLGTFLYNLEVYHSFNLGYSKLSDSTGCFDFDIELQRKGILLKSQQEVRTRIMESNDTALISDFNRIASLRNRITRLYETAPENRPDDPAELETEANDLEKSVSQRSLAYRQAKDEWKYTWKDIQDKLQPGECVIEFSSFRFFDKRWTDSTFYCALVLRPEYRYPRLIFICEEEELKSILGKAGSGNTGKGIGMLYGPNRGAGLGTIIPDSNYQQGDLYGLLWEPVDSLLHGIRTIWYAPSGLLHRISFPALAAGEGKRLCDIYQLNCLSSSRQLIRRQPDQDMMNGKGIVALFGGIKYDRNDAPLQKPGEIAGGPSLVLRSAWLPENPTRGRNFASLPGTLKEVNAIGGICREHGISARTYRSDSATEASFKSLGGRTSPEIIHLATHGFFFDDPKKDYSSRMRMDPENQPFRSQEDPLFRSGLILAGGNRAWSGDSIPEGMEDGILKAKEVSTMDLRNTRLVVLSACETGLGDVKGSEGVFGLQRSFKMAGVDYLLMSLWQVPDEATQQLMSMFYENLFNGQPVRKALQNAQTSLRNLKPEYDDPYYWAAWVLMQ